MNFCNAFKATLPPSSPPTAKRPSSQWALLTSTNNEAARQTKDKKSASGGVGAGERRNHLNCKNQRKLKKIEIQKSSAILPSFILPWFPRFGGSWLWLAPIWRANLAVRRPVPRSRLSQNGPFCSQGPIKNGQLRELPQTNEIIVISTKIRTKRCFRN